MVKASLSLVTLVSVLAPGLGRAETLLYGTGFEAPTYSPGPIGGGYYAVPQFTSPLGWFAGPLVPYTTDPSPWAVVTDTRAASGNQSLKLVVEPSNEGHVSVSRTFNPSGFNLSAGFGVSLRLFIDQAADSDVSWGLSVSDNAGVLLGMTLSPAGQVVYGHRYENSGLFFNPGFSLRNTWLDVSLEVNPTDASSILLNISNGAQNWQQVVSTPGGGANRVSIGGNYPSFPLYKTGTAYVDDLRIGYNLSPVPEPSSATLLLLGVVGLVSVRKRLRM